MTEGRPAHDMAIPLPRLAPPVGRLPGSSRGETSSQNFVQSVRTEPEVQTTVSQPRGIFSSLKSDQPRVSIIITARNYARFLPEAIESALRQSIPCEVVYSDDCSEDDSVNIARSYEKHGIIVLSTTRHLGVCEARNRGVSASTSDVLVHLDGDDVLTPDFIERHLDAMAPGAPFVYGPALAFGEGPLAGTLWQVPTWEAADLWRRNSVNTSAMYARWAFDAAGVWRNLGK